MITAREPDARRSRGTRADSRRNRDLILAAVREIFVEFGARASLDDIARRAGVGNATLYRHFADRDTLIHDVMLSIVVRAADHAEMLVAEKSDPFAAVCRFAHAAADQRVGVLCGMFATGTEEYAPDILAQRERLLSALTALMERARLTGALRGDVTIEDLLVALTQLSRPLPGIDHRDTEFPGHRRLQMFLDGLRTSLRLGNPPGKLEVQVTCGLFGCVHDVWSPTGPPSRRSLGAPLNDVDQVDIHSACRPGSNSACP